MPLAALNQKTSPRLGSSLRSHRHSLGLPTTQRNLRTKKTKYPMVVRTENCVQMCLRWRGGRGQGPLATFHFSGEDVEIRDSVNGSKYPFPGVLINSRTVKALGMPPSPGQPHQNTAARGCPRTSEVLPRQAGCDRGAQVAKVGIGVRGHSGQAASPAQGGWATGPGAPSAQCPLTLLRWPDWHPLLRPTPTQEAKGRLRLSWL